jgi:Flp pilus assembly protein TadG
MMEFAVVFPFLLVLSVSIADYGYYLEHVNNITTVTRDGTRYASENTTSLAWNAACPAPNAGSSGAYSCPGASYSTTTTAQYNAGTAYSSLSVASLPVGLSAGDNLFIGGASGPEVTLGADAVYGATSVSLSPSWTPSATVSSGSTVLWQPPSANVEALIQDEAESLTVPEGGLALDNVDCCWSSGSTGAGCPTGSTLTPGYGLTASIPTSFPAGSNASGNPSSCISIVYFASSGGTYAPASYSTVGWWSSDANSDTGCFDTSSGCTTTYPVVGDLAQVTVMYNWSGTNPGPVFDVLNSTFHLQADITAQYALVVES